MTTTLTALNNQIKTGALGFHDTLEERLLHYKKGM